MCIDLRARFHAVGKNYHNTDGSRIVRAVWHPLGVDGASLVVLSTDGMVRSVTLGFFSIVARSTDTVTL